VADVVALSVAGVRFLVRCPPGVALNDLDPCYGPFGVPAAGPAPALEVELCLDPAPSTESQEHLFDGQSWQLYGSDGRRYLKALGGAASPRWLAEFDLRPGRVKVHCGEALLNRSGQQVRLTNPVSYPLDQLLLMYVLAGQGLVLHAAGAKLGARGYLFAGSSSAGKSTLSRLLAEGEKALVLSDDRMVVREIDGTYMAFGTPWYGEARAALNECVPLSAIFFLHHSQENSIHRCSSPDALRALLPVASIPWYESELVPGVLSFTERLAARVPCFDLHFRPGTEVVDLLERFSPGQIT